MITAIAAIFVFLFVVLFHELGHFTVAKLVGIKVNEFSIGMGPKLLQKTKGDTEYTLRLLPIGGYVSMEGEDEDSEDPRGFSNASPFARILVIAAGAIMNFILAIIVFAIASYSIGTLTTTINKTIENTPAYEAGMTQGERIVSVNGNEIANWTDISKMINSENAEDNIVIETEKDNEIKSYDLKTIKSEDGKRIIGIEPVVEKNILTSTKNGFRQLVATIKEMLMVIGRLFRGNLNKDEVQVSGPIGIIKTIGDFAKQGMTMLLLLTGLISTNLGFFNLLPIPALDGSRILFILIEIIRGKPVDPEKEGMVHYIGFIFLIGLMLFVTFSDIIKLNLFK